MFFPFSYKKSVIEHNFCFDENFYKKIELYASRNNGTVKRVGDQQVNIYFPYYDAKEIRDQLSITKQGSNINFNINYLYFWIFIPILVGLIFVSSSFDYVLLILLVSFFLTFFLVRHLVNYFFLNKLIAIVFDRENRYSNISNVLRSLIGFAPLIFAISFSYLARMVAIQFY